MNDCPKLDNQPRLFSQKVHEQKKMLRSCSLALAFQWRIQHKDNLMLKDNSLILQGDTLINWDSIHNCLYLQEKNSRSMS